MRKKATRASTLVIGLPDELIKINYVARKGCFQCGRIELLIFSSCRYKETFDAVYNPQNEWTAHNQ